MFPLWSYVSVLSPSHAFLVASLRLCLLASFVNKLISFSDKKGKWPFHTYPFGGTSIPAGDSDVIAFDNRVINFE